MTVTEAKIDTAMLITWPNPAPITYGTPLGATQLNATINNVPGTFSYNPGIGTVLNAGASQMLTATFTPTDQTAYTTSVVAAFITVNPAQLTVTADNKSRGYGAANPALTATITGFTNGETLATSGVTGTPALSTTATTASAFGNYPITAAAGTLAASNYTFAFVNGTLSVTKVGLTITADNKTKVFGAANPTLTASYSGFVNGDSPASLTTPATLSTTATTASPVGAYPITVGGATAVNYSITFVPGTLTVTPAAGTTTVALSASSTSFRFGAPLTLTATVSAAGGGTPTGSVTFMDGSAVLAGPIALSGGVASFSTSSLPIGGHSVKAVYGGSASFTGSTSSAITITVNPDLNWINTTAADFNAGTLDAGAYVSQTGDGEVILKPTVGAEFSGTTLPAGWISTANVTKGSTVVGNGVVTLQGSQIVTSSLYGSGRSLEFGAT